VTDLVRASEPERALRPTFAAALRLAAVLRDRISPDTWRSLTELQRDLGALVPQAGSPLVEVLEVLDRFVLGLAAFDGLTSDGMTRTQEWRFTDMGRALERTLHTAGLLRATLVEPRLDEAAALDAVLDVADAGVTYRRRYLGPPLPEPALDLLLVDETNPRAIVFQLAMLEEHVRRLPRAGAAFRSAEERLATGMLTRVRLADVTRLATIGPSGRRDDLDMLLQALGDDLPALADALTSRYLSHAQRPRRLGDG
jgi:uncharacterized alpha-E superfamily protein